MKYKTLLSLVVAGSAGCWATSSPPPAPPAPPMLPSPPAIPSPPNVIVSDPYTNRENEELFLSKQYKKVEAYTQLEFSFCLRSHYIEMEGNVMKSFFVTEHCVSPPISIGSFLAVRFSDNSANGLADTMCMTSAKTYLGGLENQTTNCYPILDTKKLVRLADAVIFDSVYHAGTPGSSDLFKLANSLTKKNPYIPIDW